MSLFVSGTTESPSELLLNAASFNRRDAMLAAIKDGGDVNFVRMDIAPTLICAMREYEECLEALMIAGARADIPNRLGWTALHETATKESPICLDIILAYPEQSNIKCKDKDGASVLVACMNSGQMDNAKKILSAYPEVASVKDNSGNNAVMSAVLCKKVEWIEFFLKKGISPYDSNEKRENASTMVVGWEDGESVFRETGFKVGQADTQPAPKAAAKKGKSKGKTADDVTDSAVVEGATAATEDAKESNPFGLGRVKKKVFAS